VGEVYNVSQYNTYTNVESSNSSACTCNTPEVSPPYQQHAMYHHLGDRDPDDGEGPHGVVSSSSQHSRSSHPNHRGITHRTKQQRRLALLLLSICTILLFADQNLMSPNLTAIATFFGFTDEQRDQKLGGDIALAFWVLGAPASLIIGCLADVHDRIKLFAATIFLGEGACMATFWVHTYPQLYACRALTGLSVGGALPLIYSILGDMYSAEERHVVSSYVGIGTGAGISLGQGVAGFLGPKFGWRLPFMVISAPSLLCALLFFIFVDDPDRGGMEETVRSFHRRHPSVDDNDDTPPENGTIEMSPLPHDSGSESIYGSSRSEQICNPVNTKEAHSAKSHWETFLHLLSTPTFLLALLQGTPGCVPWGIVNTFLNDFLAVDRGMTVEFATFTVLLFGGGVFLGMLLGGQGGAYLYSLDKRYPAVLAGVCAISGCVPFWVLLNKVDATSSLWFLGSIAILAGVGSGVTGPIIKATLQNVTLPQHRGQAFALYTMADDFGRGLGPVFIAMMISSMGGRTPAFNVGVLGWIACGLVNLCVFCTAERDERLVQTKIAADISAGAIHETNNCLRTEEETGLDGPENLVHEDLHLPTLTKSRRSSSGS
jgi:MFS family permease